MKIAGHICGKLGECCQTPNLVLGLGVDFTFPNNKKKKKNNNNNDNNNDNNNNIVTTTTISIAKISKFYQFSEALKNAINHLTCSRGSDLSFKSMKLDKFNF